MHDATLPPELLTQLEARRGRLRVFDSLAPRRSALLVVDMQNAFVHSDGFAYVPAAAGIVDNINRLAGALREAGGTVIWIRTTLSPSGRGAWSHYIDNFCPPGTGSERRAELSPGHPSHEFWPGLEIANADLVVEKDRFSALAAGASDLQARLVERDIDTLLVAGTLTNVCCESTARDAMMLDFRVLMVEDANAARSDEDHVAGLRTFVQVFGDVVKTSEAISMIRRGSDEAC